MRKSFLLLVVVSVFFVACQRTPKDPIAKEIPAKIDSGRFDAAFFNMDTIHLQNSIQILYTKYPDFAADYFDKVLMLDPKKDAKSITAFFKAYQPIYQAAQKLNAPSKVHAKFIVAFTRFHYYFPAYKLPKHLIYYVGPLESYSNIILKDAIAIGLQMHLGAGSPWYYSEQIQTMYPPYISRKFEPNTIVVASIQNILEDYAPVHVAGKNLLTQMIEAGKKQYILDQILPDEPDSTKWGYTTAQLKALSSQVSPIYDYVLQQNMLYSTANIDIRNMMQNAASNSLFGEGIPGDVGRYLGYKIVSAWMYKYGAKVDLQQLIAMPAEKLYNEAGYKP